MLTDMRPRTFLKGTSSAWETLVKTIWETLRIWDSEEFDVVTLFLNFAKKGGPWVLSLPCCILNECRGLGKHC